MNEIINQLNARKSVRIFNEQEIPTHIKEAILESAFQAPTAGCMMLYSIIDVTDKELKKGLAVACDNQPFIEKAPLVLIFLADYQRWYDSFSSVGCSPRKPGEGDMLLACADAIIAAQNTVVAAESFGLGSCYIGDIIENHEDVCEMLNLPDFVIPAAMLVFGYPTEAQKNRKKPARFDKKYIVHENKYKSLSEFEHIKMQEERNEKSGLVDKDVKKDIKALCERKYMSDFALEMNRSAGEYFKKIKG